MDTTKRVIRVQQRQDRFNEQIPIGAKSSIDRKVSGKDHYLRGRTFRRFAGTPLRLLVTASVY
jgi:hypothetical protein